MLIANHAVIETQQIINAAHSCRTFRKDQQTFQGFVTLSIMEKLFKKHGLPLSEACFEEMREHYAVEGAEAAPALKVSYEIMVAVSWVLILCFVRFGMFYCLFPALHAQLTHSFAHLLTLYLFTLHLHHRSWSTSALSTCTRVWTRRCAQSSATPARPAAQREGTCAARTRSTAGKTPSSARCCATAAAASTRRA